jgi:hypothetical protein
MQCRGGQRDAMGSTDTFDPRYLGQDLRRRVLIIVFGAPHRPGRQNPGIEYAAEHHTNAPLLRERQEMRKRGLLKQ